MDGAAFLGIFKQADSSSEKKKTCKQMTKIKSKKKQKFSIKPQTTPLKLIKPNDKLTLDTKLTNMKESLNDIQALNSGSSNGFEDSLSSNSVGFNDSIKVKFSWSMCKPRQNNHHNEDDDLEDNDDGDDNEDLNGTMEFYEELNRHKDENDNGNNLKDEHDNDASKKNLDEDEDDETKHVDDDDDFVQPQKKLKLFNAIGNYNEVNKKKKTKNKKSYKIKKNNNNKESLTRLFKNINNNNNIDNNNINNKKNNIKSNGTPLSHNDITLEDDNETISVNSNVDGKNSNNNSKSNDNNNMKINDESQNKDSNNKINTDEAGTNDDNIGDKLMVGKRKRCAIESDDDDNGHKTEDNGDDNKDNIYNKTKDDGAGVLRRSSRRSTRILNYRSLLMEDDDDFVGSNGDLSTNDKKMIKKNCFSEDNDRKLMNNSKNGESLMENEDSRSGDDVVVVEDKRPQKMASLFDQKSKINEKVMSQEKIDALERKRKFLFSGSIFKVKKDYPVLVKNNSRTATYLAPLPIFNHTTQLVIPSSSFSSSFPPLKDLHPFSPIFPPQCQLLKVAVHELKKHVVIPPIIESVIILCSPSSSQPSSLSSSQPSSQPSSNKPKLRDNLEDSTTDVILREIHRQNPSFNITYMYNSLKNKKEIFNQNYFKVTEPILWTEKYCPTSWQDFVGNGSNFKKVYDWLNECKSKLPSCADNDLWDNIDRKGYDESSNSRDSFFYRGGNDRKKNNDSISVEGHVLVVEGPNGVGKTSLIHVLALSLGFKVIEVNSSFLRDGRHLMSQLQEATQSHQISRGAHVRGGGFFSSGGSESANVSAINTGSSITVSNGASNDGNESINLVEDDVMRDNKEDDGVVGVVSDEATMSEDEEEEEDDDIWDKKLKNDKKTSFMGMFKQVKSATTIKKIEKTPKNKIIIKKTSTRTKGKRGRKKKATKINKKEPKTLKKDNSKPPKPSLILFDEADICFETDKGFYSTIQRFINISKRPIIITCNHSIDNRLHANMSRVHLSRPSMVDLSCYLRLVSSLEGFVISNGSLKQLIDSNSCDVRKCLLQLQLTLETMQGSNLLGKRLVSRGEGLTDVSMEEKEMVEGRIDNGLTEGGAGNNEGKPDSLDVTLIDESDQKLENKNFKDSKIFSFFGDKNDNKIKDEEDDDDFVETRITRSHKTPVISEDDEDDRGDEDEDDDNDQPKNHYQDDNLVYIADEELNNDDDNESKLLLEEYKVDDDDVDDGWCLDLFTNNIKPGFKNDEKNQKMKLSLFRSPFLKRSNRLSVFDGFSYDVKFAFKNFSNRQNNENVLVDRVKIPKDTSDSPKTSKHHPAFDRDILNILYRSYDSLSLLDSSLPLHPPPSTDHIDKHYGYYCHVLPGCNDATWKHDDNKNKNISSNNNNIISNNSNRNNVNNNNKSNNNKNMQSHINKEMFDLWYECIIIKTTLAFDRVSQVYNCSTLSKNHFKNNNRSYEDNDTITTMKNSLNDVIEPLKHAAWSHDRLYGRIANQLQVSEILRRHWMVMDKNSFHLYYLSALRCICRLEKMRKKKKRRFLHYLRHHLPPTLAFSTFKTTL